MENDIFKKIVRFVEEERWKYTFELKRSTKLDEELTINGDDAKDFIRAFGRKFNIDVANFIAVTQFEEDGEVIIPSAVRFLTGKKKLDFAEMTLGHLEKAVIKGKLDETILEVP
jgi:hypothetical protein